MKHIKVAFILAVTLLNSNLNLAQSGGGYDLTLWTVDGGGQTVSGGGYALIGTVGQPEPEPVHIGGSYVLYGGFWAGGSTQYKIHFPIIRRN
jgi:hypothetical protein